MISIWLFGTAVPPSTSDVATGTQFSQNLSGLRFTRLKMTFRFDTSLNGLSTVTVSPLLFRPRIFNVPVMFLSTTAMAIVSPGWIVVVTVRVTLVTNRPQRSGVMAASTFPNVP